MRPRQTTDFSDKFISLYLVMMMVDRPFAEVVECHLKSVFKRRGVSM